MKRLDDLFLRVLSLAAIIMSGLESRSYILSLQVREQTLERPQARSRTFLQKDISKKAPTFREEMNCEKYMCTVMP
jgi:hypothetical protein